MLPRTDLDVSFPTTVNNATFAAERTTFNANFEASLGSIATIIDVTTIPQGADSDNATYYGDQVHPTPALYALLGARIADSIEGIL